MNNESFGLAFDIVEGIVNYSCMGLVIVTIPIYLVVVAVLFFEKHSHSINNVFFTIYLIGGLIDISAMFNNYFGSIFPAKGWLLWYYLSSPTTGRIYLMIAWGTRMSQGCTVLLLAFNRTTAVLRPTSYGKFWTQRVGRAAIAFQIIPGILYGGILSFTELFWQQKSNGGWYIQFGDPVFRLRYFAASFVFQSILLFLIAGNYVIVLLFFRVKYGLAVLPSDARSQRLFKDKQKQEKRLVYISMIVCTLEIICFFFSVYFFVINTTVNTRVFYLIYNGMNDLYAATPPYLLILFSTPFKRNLIKFLGLEVSDRSSTGTVPVIRIQQSTPDAHSHHKRDVTVSAVGDS
ncbi:srv-7 [Pristionchus pacificus]|uniref:Srv-7 n=1 Tax=Pristionchus pacificus TaxID=54126 RepID=A0A2A6D0N9_PRIPA|nr:srv-7 [Pristionchus pacificus]|eukprot:PDM84034.1 srv-7 [Pristionchus pacificus]